MKIPALVISVFVCLNACHHKITSTKSGGNGKLERIEETARFPGCESNWNGWKSKDACAGDKMLEYIQSRISCKIIEPEKIKSTNPVLLITFNIEENGQISEVLLAKNTGTSCDEMVLNAVKTFPDWIPGKRNGKPVKMKYYLPLKFEQ